MVRVTGIGAGYAAPRRPGRGGGFALPGAPESTEAASAAGVSGVSLLALQEAGAVLPDPERARRRAAQALDALRDLQLGLLSGGSDPARLERLAALAAAEAVADPGLRAILDQVSLRARVELARFRALSASQA